MATVVTNEDARINIAENLQRLLSALGWKQADLARATGESEMTISHMVRGARLPSAALLARVAEALQTSSEHLLTPHREKLPEKSA
jgi:transcriptional regulator with XRE-family HTH domain